MSAPDIEITPELLQAVRQYECRMQGHTYDVIVSMGNNEPEAVVCSRCGLSWAVGR